MIIKKHVPRMVVFAVIIWLFMVVPGLFGQMGALSGHISDESGAAVPSAAVILLNAGSMARTTVSDRKGNYLFASLPAGRYRVVASATRLSIPKPFSLTIGSESRTVNLLLIIPATSEAVTVTGSDDPAARTDASANASAARLSGENLQSLADDSGDLKMDLEALAGPSTGPDGSEIFIDGFSGGQLPSKESISEVRVNESPFAPEFDKVGAGRIEIFTKSPIDRLHYALTSKFGTDWWNSRNPYANQKAPFLLRETQDNVGGPLGKQFVFTLDFAFRSIDNGSVSNGVALDRTTLALTPFNSVFRTPQREITIHPHINYRLNESNTLSLAYTLARVSVDNAGIGGFDISSRGYDLRNNFDTLQATETSLHGSLVNETHVQYYRWGYAARADSQGPALLVPGAFNGGAASTPYDRDIQTASEVQNLTSYSHGSHLVRFGGRLRLLTDDSYAMQGFNGAFTFAGGLAPALDSENRPITDASGDPLLTQISGIEQYRRTLLFERSGYSPAQIRQWGGGATQFTITSGTPQTKCESI